MTLEKTILYFREYASKVLKEQTDHVSEFDNNNYLSGKLARLKFVNAHLKELKEQLSNVKEQLLSEHASASFYDDLKASLENIKQEYINEYMYIGFTKNK